MRREQELIAAAKRLKTKLLKRADHIRQVALTVANYDAYLAQEISPEAIETARGTLVTLGTKQHQDCMELAVLRWALGITEEVDMTDLGLKE